MFGQYLKTLDEKKRLVIPAKLRKDLGKVVYITLNSEQVLEVRSSANFNELKRKLLTNNSLNKTMRQYARIIFANTAEVEVDKIGRINLPETLLGKATIKKEVIILGVGNKLELWPKRKYDAFEIEMNQDNQLEQLVDKLFNDGAII